VNRTGYNPFRSHLVALSLSGTRVNWDLSSFPFLASLFFPGTGLSSFPFAVIRVPTPVAQASALSLT
jgi:hypothetical protein